jgi:nicotinate-nucleotide adenylyltransferase
MKHTDTAKRIGIYSGAFDPVHSGHIGLARTVLAANKLDAVYIAPEPKPRGKPGVSSMEQRLAMLQLAIQPHAELQILTIPHEHFSISQTLPFLRQQFPDAELTLLIGSDVVATFAYRWPDLGELFRSMTLAIGLRSSDDPAAMQTLLEQAATTTGIRPQYTLHASPLPHTASRVIRTKHVLEHVSPEVGRYIQSKKLYA